MEIRRWCLHHILDGIVCDVDEMEIRRWCLLSVSVSRFGVMLSALLQMLSPFGAMLGASLTAARCTPFASPRRCLLKRNAPTDQKSAGLKD